MPARSQSRNLWPFAKKKRVVLSKEDLKRIGDIDPTTGAFVEAEDLTAR